MAGPARDGARAAGDKEGAAGMEGTPGSGQCLDLCILYWNPNEGQQGVKNDKYWHREKLGSSGVHARLDPHLLLYNPETQHVYYGQHKGRGLASLSRKCV